MGRRLFKAANTTDSAIAGSTRRDGSATAPSVARLRVIECATVKAVTIPNTFQNAGENASTGSHRPFVRWERSEEHTSELQSRGHVVCRLLLENKNALFPATSWT